MVSIVSEARNKIYKIDRSWHQYVQVRSRTIEVASAGTIGGGGTIGRPELHFDSLPATNIQIYTQPKMFAEHDQKYKQRVISIC